MAYIGRHIKRWWEQDELIKRLYCPDASRVSYRGGRPHRLEPIGVATYSPVTTDFMQPAEVWLPIGDTPIVIVGEDGELLPTQIEKREQIETNSLGRPRNDYYPHEVYRKVTFMSCQRMGRISAVAAIPTTSERLREICADSIKRDANVVDVVAKPDIGDNTSAVNVTHQIAADDSYIDNGLLRVDVAGAVLHITDKQTGRTYYNLNLIEEDADAGDAWDYSPTWLPSEVVQSSRFSFTSRLCEVGSVKAVILIDGSMSVPERLHGDLRSENRVELPMTFEVIVWRDTKRVDIKLTLDNRARDHRLRLRIPFMFDTDEIISQGQLAILRRKIERQTEIEPWVQPPTRLMPCREWIAASDGDCGLAVALKGMYDYEAQKDKLTGRPDVFITLLRGFELMGRLNTVQRAGGASSAVHTPGAQCLGRQVFEWSYAPYKVSDDDIAPFLPTVQSFLSPTTAHLIRSESEDEMYNSEELFGWDEPNLQFSAFKRSLDRDGYILRCYENQGKPTTLHLRVSDKFSRAWRSNMNEEELAPLELVDGRLELKVGAYEAVSILLR